MASGTSGDHCSGRAAGRGWGIVLGVAASCSASSGGSGHAGPEVSDGQAPVAIEEGPAYLGTVDDAGGCAHPYKTTGFRPADGAPHPLFLYFVGTDFTGVQPDVYASQAPVDVTSAMARRGYVALSVQYDNSATAWASDHANLLQCLFADPAGLLPAVCGAATLHVDCDLGIATWGHSLGGAVALLAANSDRRVRAAWATGVTGITGAMLPVNRLRVVNGADDAVPVLGDVIGNNNDPSRLDTQTGVTAADCPSQTDQCLRPDGSGWILVQSPELDPPRSPDHCWFDNTSCSASGERVEPNFAGGTSRISIAANADWLVAAASTAW